MKIKKNIKMAKHNMSKKKHEELVNMEWEELKKNPVNNFQCDTCKSDLMPLAEFKKHLAKVHKLDTEKLQANRKMLMHIDGDYWFSSTYEWILPGLQFTQYVQFAREKSHMF